MSDNNKIALAICGLGGFVKRRILPALTSCSNIELVAVVDRSMIASDLSPAIRRFSSLDELLKSDFADAVYLATPNHLHCLQTMQCLEAGRHVLCEKPMATNSKDCEQMLDVAQKNHRQLTIGHMLRYSPAMLGVRQWIQSGRFGKPQSLNIKFHYYLPESKRSWAFRPEFSGGGALIDAGIHCIDLARFLIGDPVIVQQSRMDFIRSSGVEQLAECSFTVAGVPASLNVRSDASYASNLTVDVADGEILVNSFAACWDCVALKYVSFKNSSLNHEVIVDVSGTYAQQLETFANQILNREMNYSSAVDGLENAKIIDKLYAISVAL